MPDTYDRMMAESNLDWLRGTFQDLKSRALACGAIVPHPDLQGTELAAGPTAIPFILVQDMFIAIAEADGYQGWSASELIDWAIGIEGMVNLCKSILPTWEGADA